MAAKLAIRADVALCKGARACVRRAPETFSLNERRTVVIAPEPGDGEAAIVDAARACPNFAIEVFRDGERLA